MCGHVIVTFEGVLVIRLALPHEMVEDILHVYAYIRVCVLVDCQGSRGVLYEEMEQSRLGQCRQLPHDFPCDEMEAG